MHTHGRPADHQSLGDLLVVQALRDQSQNLDFPFGQRMKRRLLAFEPPIWVVEELAGNRLVKVDPSCVNIPNGVNDLLWSASFRI